MKDFNEWFDEHRADAEAKGYAKMPYYVCVIDEWADLVMQDKSVDDPVMRLGQLNCLLAKFREELQALYKYV